MKTFKIIALISFIFLGFQNEVVAQNRKINKATKKQLRSFMKDPASYREKELAAQENIDNAALKISDLEELSNKYADSITALNAQVSGFEKINNERQNIIEQNFALAFRVQIGAYAVNDFDKKAVLGNVITTEETDGVSTYYVGSFQDPLEAEALASAIRKMGISDAFVTKFVNRERISFDIKDLIEAE